MSYTNAVALNGVADVLDKGISNMWKFVDREDRLKKEAREDELRALQMDHYRTATETNKFELEGKRQERLVKEEEGELLAAMQSGDLSGLRPELAVKINKHLADQKLDPEYIASRVTSAKFVGPMVGKLAEQAAQFQQQVQTGATPGMQQQDMVHLSSDPSFGELKPHLKNVFFDKDRFKEKDGTPKLHQYDVGGKTVFGTVDPNDPVADVLFQRSTGQVMVPLKIRAVQTDDKGNPIKDEAGNLLFDDTLQIPNGIATTGRGNSPDDPIATLTLPELKQKTDELAKSGTLVLQAHKKALEAELIKRSPEVRKNLSQSVAGRIQNQQLWKDAEADESIKSLFDDPLMGGSFKNLATVTRAFGGSPKEALAKAQGVIEKAQTLAADKAEGQAFIDTFGGIMDAAGKNPENPYAGIVDFFKSNPAMVGRKGAVEAVKAAQTAIASDRKDKTDRRRDELGWARVEALASRSASSAASKTVSQDKRDATLRLREAQRAHAAAVKSGDPDKINEAVDFIEDLNANAQDVGVKPLPVPKRPMTTEQEEALRTQAVENLKAKRGAIGRLFNSKPSAKAVADEMKRLQQSGAQPSNAEPQMTGERQVDHVPGSAVQAAAARTSNPATRATPAGAAQPQAQPSKAMLSGNAVVVNGQSHPLNPDGTVTIGGRKYRVQ